MKQLLFILGLTLNIQNMAQAVPSSYELIKCQGLTESGKSIAIALYANTEESMWLAYSTVYVTIGNQEIAQELESILIGNSFKEEGDIDLKTYDTLDESNVDFEFHGAKALGSKIGIASLRVRSERANNLKCSFE